MWRSLLIKCYVYDVFVLCKWVYTTHLIYMFIVLGRTHVCFGCCYSFPQRMPLINNILDSQRCCAYVGRISTFLNLYILHFARRHGIVQGAVCAFQVLRWNRIFTQGLTHNHEKHKRFRIQHLMFGNFHLESINPTSISLISLDRCRVVVHGPCQAY